MQLFFKVVSRVVCAGEKSKPCEKATNSAGVAEKFAALASC